MTNYFIYIIILANILFFIFYFRKKIRKFFYNPKIKIVSIEEVDEIFIPVIKKNNLKIPKKDTFINTFFVPSTFNVVGMTSDYESWILSSLSKKALNIFEFGTCSGRTTFLFAINSNENCKIYTITLDPKKLDIIKKKIMIIIQQHLIF